MENTDYLKYMTERAALYLSGLSENDQVKAKKRASREPWLTRWFGVLPMGLQLWWAMRADKKREAHPEVRSVHSSP